MAPWSRAASGRGPASRRWGTALAALVVAQALAAQEPPPTFRAESQVVVLDMVARDGRDRPITDLRQDEVQVFEDGEACTIVSFRLVRGLVPEATVAATSGSPAEAPPAADASAAAPTRANLVVLLFDRLSVANAAAARRGALDLLSKRFPADTWFAVYKLDQSMRLLQPFTSEPQQLVTAVDIATSGDEAKRIAAGLAPSASVAPPGGGGIPARPDLPGRSPATQVVQVAAGVDRELADLGNGVEALDAIYAIRALARGLGEVRGRKSIVYFSEDREFPERVALLYEQAIDTANRANVTVHSVDARGLSIRRVGDLSPVARIIEGQSASAPTGASLPGSASLDRSDGPGGPMMERAAVTGNPLQGSFLSHVAKATGGLVINNTNDLGAGLVKVVEEVGQYYEVVYEPPRPEPDGRFRQISAKTTRKGARLNTRSGYFATAGSSPTVAAFELPLLGAMGAAETPRDFPHASTVLHFASTGREREALFLAEVPLGSAKVIEDADRGLYRAHLTLLGFVRDEAGRAVARFSQDWPLEGPIGELPRLPGTTAVFKRAITLAPGGYTLVTAIQDRQANRTSVERSRFDVPPAEGGLAVGSLSVVRKASGEPASGPDPFRVGGVTISPHVGGGELPVGTKEVSIFMPIYPSLGAAPVGLELEVRHAGDTVARSTPVLPAVGTDGRIAWIGSLPAKGLTPGRYEVVAKVRQGEAVAEERAAFEVPERSTVESRTSPAPAGPPAVPEDLVPVLEAAARYVLEYEASFQNIAAEETYLQRALPRYGNSMAPVCLAGGCLQTTKANVVFARLSGDVPWGCFRDVYEVDGRKVRDTEGRLEALFAQFPIMGAAQRAEALLAESARYNVGPALRNINFPTLALAFLHPMNQGRFAWSRGGKRRFGTTEGIEVEFDEVARPTIVDRGGQSDLPARGRFWIDPSRGTVLRSETSFRFEVKGIRMARAYVATEYRPEPKLAMWVPAEMREEYEDMPSASVRIFGSRTEATARYGGFRRFTVSTEEEARAPEGDDPGVLR